MKTLLGVLAACSLAGAAQAQTTVIEITGATAFRSAAIASLNLAFTAGGPFAFAFSNTSASGGSTSATNGSAQIWRGTFPGITGTTIVRTSWNGSVEGIRAVAVPGIDPVTGDNNDPLYILASVLGANGTSIGIPLHSDQTATNPEANYEQAQSDMSFSDVAQSSTPISGLSLSGGPVGVVVFSMIAGRSWSDDELAGGALATRLTPNITAQQFRSMARLGFVPLSFFTGEPTDTTRVFLTGRNDGSGTRTSYLSETGIGASTPIRQYVGYDRTSSSTNLPSIFLVPANGGFDAQGNAHPEYRSTVWGNNQDGNGGHVSSSDVRTDLPKTTSNTTVFQFVDLDESGDASADEAEVAFAAAKLYMISWVTYNDARTARGTGLASARTSEILAYDGVRLEGLAGDNPASAVSGADLAKVVNGAYTPWNFQQLLYVSSRTGATTVFNELRNRFATDPSNPIGSAGVRTSLMNVNRTTDGGVILPGGPQ